MKLKLPKKMKKSDLLGLDLGTKRIGVARMNSAVGIPEPLEPIKVDGTEFASIASLANEIGADKIIVGLPRSASGQESEESARVRTVFSQLKEYIPNKSLELFDESTSSLLADDVSSDSSMPYAGESRDSLAAALILKGYINESQHSKN